MEPVEKLKESIDTDLPLAVTPSDDSVKPSKNLEDDAENSGPSAPS
jgi:hypothetical protein